MTYSFDPLFFERVVLHDLWAGGSSDILVIADGRQAAEGVRKAAGHLSHLGRRYQLVAVSGVGAQHAKLLIRIGVDGALVWLGSNNLTAPAWSGGNRELCTAWRVDRTDVAGTASVRNILLEFSQLSTPTARQVIERALDHEWLASVTESEDLSYPVLISGSGGTISQQLEKRWAGRKFQHARVITGSTDENGAMLRWLATRFGVREATVALDPKRSAFQPSKLQRLPLAVRIVPLEGHPVPHAKFCWLEGRNGSAAIMGSANCSAAAWLVSPKNGGNIESVAVYDSCEPEPFNSCLELCRDESALLPHNVPNLGKVVSYDTETSNTPAIQLLELSCNSQIGELRATVTSPIRSAALVELDIAGSRLPLLPSDDNRDTWLGPMPDLANGWTHFGRLIVHYISGKTECSESIWLNEEDELQQAIRGRQLSTPILNLSRADSKSSDQQKLLQELAQVASVLFSNHTAFPDPIIGRSTANAQQEAREQRLVDPDELVRSLSELEERHHIDHSVETHGNGLALVGVMRVLFPSVDQTSADELAERSSEEKDQEVDQDRTKANQPEQSEPPRESFRKRLIQQVDAFLDRLAQPEFAQRCTATQLVQAAAFPLAVGVKALDGAWIDRSIADSWTFRVADLLFRVAGPDRTDTNSGLLAMIRDRYRRENRPEVFEKVVGDGRLWVALSAALLRMGAPGEHGGLERALALRDVFAEPLLWNGADASRLRSLLARIDGDRKGVDVLKAARRIARIVQGLEKQLAAKGAHYFQTQEGEVHALGDPLWKSGVGFGRAEETTPIEEHARIKVYLRKRAKVVPVVATYYTNLRIAANHDRKLAELLDQLAPCWPGHRIVQFRDYR